MSACTFFGHRECFDLEATLLMDAVEQLILQGVDVFYVGNHGGFDRLVYGCLKKLRATYPHIRICVVLSRLPSEGSSGEELSDAMFPRIEGHPKFAVDRRNRWMIAAADCCICYVNYTWGGAYKYAALAKRKGLSVINLGKTRL